MTEPSSLDRATFAIGDLSGSVRALHSEVVQAEKLRTSKIKWIQRVLYILVPCVLLLLLLAATNAVLLNRVNSAARDAKSTNELLLGCFQPNTACARETVKANAERLNQIRQTQFVIAICQRQNPLETDPHGVALIHCVQRYYPGFALPATHP
jgi:hypothetical protein